MNYKINFESFSNNFALPQAIIDDSFESLDSSCLKIILLIYKNSDKHYSVNLLSNLLNISEAKVEQGIAYWISKGILKEDNAKVIDEKSIVVNTLKSGKAVPASIPPVTNNKEYVFLLQCMEGLVQRPITSTEQKTIAQILEFLKLPADVVLMAIDFCISQNKLNARYIEAVCTDWAERGINTHELAEQYLSFIKKNREKESQVKRILGISDRKLIDSEINFIRRWLSEFAYDIDVIQLAYERTIKSIGKLAFPYMNKILLSWHEKNYKNLDDINANEGYSKLQPSEKRTSYDIDELDRFWDNVPKLD